MAVNQHDIDTVPQALVLQTVIEEKNVAVEVPQSMEPALHAVLVDEDAHAGKIFGQHVRFVSGTSRIEEDVFAVGNDAWREEVEVFEDFVAQSLCERTRDAFVPAAEDGHAASAALQFAGQHFRNGRLARPAHRQIPDADHGAAQFLRPEKASAVESEPDLHRLFVDFGEAAENELERVGPSAFAALKDDVDGIPLEPLENNSHGQDSTCVPRLSAPRTRTRADGSADCIAVATESGWSTVTQATAEPDPLKYPPRAPASTPAEMARPKWGSLASR